MDLGHWRYPKEFNPDDWFGFLYRIIDTETKKEYIGKKQFHAHRTKKVVNRKNRKHFTVDSNWKKYTSSSDIINELILEFGKERFVFLIESLHKTKASLTYAEVNQLIMENALRAKLPDGNRKYYNKIIPAIKFLPPEDLDEERSSKIWMNATSITHNDYFDWSNLSEEDKLKFLQNYKTRL